MSLTRSAGGTAVLTLLVVALAVTAVSVRRRLVPAWTGAASRLAEVVVALFTVTIVAEVLGTIGWLRRGPLVTATVAVAAVAFMFVGRSQEGGEAPTPPPPLVATVASVLVAASVVGAWVTHTLAALRDGVTHYDSLWYHLSRAARFAQDGSITALHFTRTEFPDTFHPSGSELLHAVAMLAYGRDAISPLVNLGWLAAALLAAWCVGRPWGAGPVSLAGAAVVLGSPLVVVEHGGSASNDVAALALLLAAAAFLLQPTGAGGRTLLAGVAAGLAIAVKLTVLVPVAVLTVLLVLHWARRREWGQVTRWTAALAVAGAFWYVVMLARTGSPLPGSSFGPFPSARFEIVERVGYSVADYLTDGAVWRDWFRPGLRADFGAAWVIVLAAAAVFIAGALFRRGVAHSRRLALSVAAGVAAYAVLPTTALGERDAPVLFAANVVYAVPVLALALCLPATWRSLHDVRRQAGAVAAFGALVVVEAGGGVVDPWVAGERVRGMAGAALVATGLLVVVFAGRRAAAALAVVGALVLAAGVSPLVRDHVDDRWRSDPVFRWGQSASGARIALAGYLRQHPLTGRRLDNHVQYVGVRGAHGAYGEPASCDAWWRLLREGRFDHVVVGREWYDARQRAERLSWIAAGPAREILDAGDLGRVFALDRDGDPACGTVPRS